MVFQSFTKYTIGLQNTLLGNFSRTLSIGHSCRESEQTFLKIKK